MSRIAALVLAIIVSCATDVGRAQLLPDVDHLYRLSTQYKGEASGLDADIPERVYLKGAARTWRFEPAGDGFYRLTTLFNQSTMCLDVYADTLQARLGTCANYSGQLWRTSNDGRWVRLSTMFRGPSFCLDVYGDTLQAHIKPCGNYSGQLWSFTKDDANVPVGQPPPGTR